MPIASFENFIIWVFRVLGKGEAEMVQASLKIYQNLVTKLEEGVKTLFIAEELTNLAKNLAKVNIAMEKVQRDALNVILKINQDAQLAIHYSRVVVMKLKNICNDLLFILEDEHSEEVYKDAIQVYLDESKLIMPDIESAIDKLVTVGARSTEGTHFFF